MENLHERIVEVEKDTEVTARIAHALGFYSCENDIYPMIEHEDSRWIIRSID